MNLDLDAKLMERMSEGIVLLNPEGRITEFNRAARPWLKRCRDAVPQLGKLIKDVASGAATAPVIVPQMFPPGLGAALVDVYLCKNGPQGYALFIAPLMTQGESQSMCASCRIPQQAEVYARDLAVLMPPRPVGADISKEEFQFLAQVTANAPVSSEILKSPE